MSRCWIAVASAEHVRFGRAHGFMQVCHGKAAPLRRISPGDRVAYYSPTVTFRDKDTLQAFTALGTVMTRHGLLDPPEAQTMVAWEHGVAASWSMPRCASKPTTATASNASCATVPGRPLRANGCARSTPGTWPIRVSSPARAAAAACC